MVKRVKTPPPPDDEPKYYTVHQPYPINANMEMGQDRIAFARWIASIMGDSDSFFAIYHKPSAPAMIIVEIDYQFPTRLLLGEHRWGEFMKTPDKLEKSRVSQIFHSFYSSGRAVQKDGWLRLDVQAQWFYDWSHKDCDFAFPFPSSHYCDVPKEDKTNKPLCRPLPTGVIPPPPKAAKPVVGSSDWAGGKQTPVVNLPSARAQEPVRQGNPASSKPQTKSVSQGNNPPAQTTVIGPPARGLQPVPQSKKSWASTPPAAVKQSSNTPAEYPSLKASVGAPTPTQSPAWARSNDKVKEATKGGAVWGKHTGKGVVKAPDVDSWSAPAPEVDWGEPEPTSNVNADDDNWTVMSNKPKKPVTLWAQEYADDAIVCPEHWDCPKLCKRGICSAYGEAKRAKEKKDRDAGKPPSEKGKGKKRSKGKSRAGGANSTNGTASSVASETSTRPSSSLNSDSRLGGAASPLSVSSPSPPINTRSESVASSDQESSLPASSSAVPGQPLLDDGESDDDVDPWF